MRTYFKLAPFLLSVLLLTAGCGLEGIEPEQGQTAKLTKVSMGDNNVRVFSYGSQRELTHIKGGGSFALNENENSESIVTFNAKGQIILITTTGDYLTTENVYHYNSIGQLQKLEEKINGSVESYYTYEYDNGGKLSVRYSYFKTGNASTPKETLKHTYVYDARGNVSEIAAYSQSAGVWLLSHTTRYENYDTHPSVMHLTGSPFTPTIILHWNNPGKTTITHQSDGRQQSSAHAYEYNSLGLTVKKTTTPTGGTPMETAYTYSY
ncbi:MAG: hypothetical protein ACO1OQ_02580 [Rufibacter sp.]